MFREIEGRLEGSWDLYIKALKQYKEREGDCLVPYGYIEVVNGISVSLGHWCRNIRSEKMNRAKNYLLTEEMEKQLTRLGFVWNVRRSVFENNIKAVSEYYSQYGKYPLTSAKEQSIKSLGMFINIQKSLMRNGELQQWKKQIINQYLPEFCYETRSDKTFNTFIYYIKLYKKKYGHVNVKQSDVIDGYKIGSKLATIVKDDKNNKLSNDKKAIIEKHLGKSLSDFFNRGDFVKVIDIVEDKEIGIYKSHYQAAKVMQERFNVKINGTGIFNRSKGKITTPYKGRFMFYYATDEEVKKYLEENRAS